MIGTVNVNIMDIKEVKTFVESTQARIKRMRGQIRAWRVMALTAWSIIAAFAALVVLV